MLDLLSVLKDETGKFSGARCFLAGQLFIVDVLGFLDGWWGGDFDLPGPWWALQGGLLLALVAWAAGPRGLQYLGPQVGKMASALSARIKGTDRFRKDDERG